MWNIFNEKILKFFFKKKKSLLILQLSNSENFLNYFFYTIIRKHDSNRITISAWFILYLNSKMIFSEILWAKYLLVCLASIFIFTKKISTKTPTKPLCCFCTGSNKLHGCRKHLQLPNTHARVHTYIRKYIRTYSSHCRRVTFACCYFCKLSQACCGFFSSSSSYKYDCAASTIVHVIVLLWAFLQPCK